MTSENFADPLDMHRSLRNDPCMVTLLSSREACERLAIDRSTLTRWVQSGRITALRTAPYVFTEAEVEKAAEQAAS